MNAPMRAIAACAIVGLGAACARAPREEPTPPARPSASATTAATATTSRAAVSPRPLQVTDSSIRIGRAVYTGKGNCHHCHGDDGRGGPLGPNLADSVWIHGDGSYESLLERVVHGVPAPRNPSQLPMPEREIADLRYPEISAVAAYVWSLRERPK